MNLTPASIPLIYDALVVRLAPYVESGLIGVSCVAPGADSIFAEAVLHVGGRLEVLIPARDYRITKVTAAHAPQFDALLSRATVDWLPFPQANRDAYEAANHAMVSRSDMLFAVWDGEPDPGKGSTASAVAYARARGVPVAVVWPDGATRDRDAPRTD